MRMLQAQEHNTTEREMRRNVQMISDLPVFHPLVSGFM